MTEETQSTIANVARLNEMLDKDGVAAVVLRSGSNFTYLAGFDYAGTLARHLDFSDSPRGVFVVWPRHGDPVMVLNKFAAPRAQRDSWLEHIVVFDDYSESAYTAVAKVLHDMGLGGARIGFEKMVISAAHWEEIEHVLPKASCFLLCWSLLSCCAFLCSRGSFSCSFFSCCYFSCFTSLC